jgi:hypothetical protein
MYTKECPKCTSTQIYSTSNTLSRAIKGNYICKQCSDEIKGLGLYKEVPYKWFNKVTRDAINRHKTFNITIQDVWEIYEEQGRLCALSGRPIGWNGNQMTGHNISIDRIDSSLGYEPDNIQLVTVMANLIKLDYPIQDFLLIVKDIAEWHGLTEGDRL